MNLKILCAMATATAVMAAGALAQQAPNFAAVQIKTIDLGHKTWMLAGQGGNMTVIAGDDGIILVDTEFAPLHDKIKAAIAQVSDKPVRYVVNTHFHGDHTGGNQAFWLEGATIVGNDQMAQSLLKGTANTLTGVKIPPAPRASIPTVTYADHMSLSVKGRTVQLTHLPNAHTGGDTAIWIPDANVLVTGDMVVSNDRFPNIDEGDGGSIDGIIKSVDVFLKRANARTEIVPGHGPLMNRDQLVAYRKLLIDARAAVSKLKAAGKTEAEAVAAKPLAGDIQTRAHADDAGANTFVKLLYRSVG